MTLVRKILSLKAGRELSVGEIVLLDVDLALANDITAPLAISEFYNAGLSTVKAPDKTIFVMDHFAPNKDIKSAENCKTVREFSKRNGIANFYDSGKAGVEHAFLPEQGFVKPASIIIGADSHTCTYGALGAFSTGIGSTDFAFFLKTGKCWIKVPETIKIELRNQFNKYVSGKDLALHLISVLGVDGANYKALEFTGDGVAALSADDRMTVANMAVECGAKCAIFPTDDVTFEYLDGRVKGGFPVLFADPDAEYSQVLEIDLSAIKPTVAFPYLPSNAKTLPLDRPLFIDQVVIGSCTNGRLSDIERAMNVLGERRVADGVRLIVIPATQQVFKDCVKLGYAERIVDAGGVFSTPTCGPCLGGYMGILASGERCVATTNRNFVGRMGAKDSEVYLASPEVAMASAVAGRICSPEEL